MVPQPTRSNRSIRRVLALIAVISLPQIGLTALTLRTFGEEARLRRELLFRHEAIVLRDAIDQEFARLFATAEALAASPSITAGDVQAFRQKALGMRDVVAAEVTLASSDGTLLVDTRAPAQAPSPDREAFPPLERRLMKGPRVQIVRAQNDQAGRSLIVAAPIKTAGPDRLTPVVSLHLSLDRFGQILNRDELRPGWAASIIDQQGGMVARMPGSIKIVGSSAERSRLEETVHDWGHGTLPGLDGQPVFMGYARSRLAGWLVSIEAKADLVRHREFRTKRDILIVAFLTWLASMIVAVRMLRRSRKRGAEA